LIDADSVPHAGSVLSDAELARLSSWPDEIADDDQLQLAGDDVPRLLSAYGGWGGRTRHDHRTLVLDRLARCDGRGTQAVRRVPSRADAGT
jgi:hypothetical protein